MVLDYTEDENSRNYLNANYNGLFDYLLYDIIFGLEHIFLL
jgi:hypothetical protein